MPKLRIFIADDHPFLLEGLKAKVNAEADMEKLELNNRADLVRYATHQGWLNPD